MYYLAHFGLQPFSENFRRELEKEDSPLRRRLLENANKGAINLPKRSRKNFKKLSNDLIHGEGDIYEKKQRLERKIKIKDYQSYDPYEEAFRVEKEIIKKKAERIKRAISKPKKDYTQTIDIKATEVKPPEISKVITSKTIIPNSPTVTSSKIPKKVTNEIPKIAISETPKAKEDFKTPKVNVNKTSNTSSQPVSKVTEKVKEIVTKTPPKKVSMKVGTKLGLGILGLGILGAGLYGAKKLRDSRSDKGRKRGKYKK